MKKLFLIIMIAIVLSEGGWRRQNSPVAVNFYSVYFPSDTLLGFICGDNGKILRTTNSGSEWREMITYTTEQLRCITFINDTGYACGTRRTILKSTDRGLTWVGGPGGELYTLFTISFPRNATVGFVFGEEGRALKTTNGGLTWEILSIPQPITIYDCFFLDEMVGYIVGERGMVFRTTNGGNSWMVLPTGVTQNLNSIWFLNNQVGYICGDSGTVLKTTDGGRRWENISFPYSEALYGIVVPASPDTSFLCGERGIIGRCVDGRSWGLSFPRGDTNLFAIHFPRNNQVGFAVGANGMILKTSDGGIGIEEEEITPLKNNFLLTSKREFEINLEKYPAEIKILDIFGRNILSLEKRGASEKITLKDLKKGIYFIKIKTDEKIINKKICLF